LQPKARARAFNPVQRKGNITQVVAATNPIMLQLAHVNNAINSRSRVNTSFLVMAMALASVIAIEKVQAAPLEIQLGKVQQCEFQEKLFGFEAG